MIADSYLSQQALQLLGTVPCLFPIISKIGLEYLSRFPYLAHGEENAMQLHCFLPALRTQPSAWSCVLVSQCRPRPLKRNSLFLSFASANDILGAVSQKQHPLLSRQACVLTPDLLVLLLLSCSISLISFTAVLKVLSYIYQQYDSNLNLTKSKTVILKAASWLMSIHGQF